MEYQLYVRSRCKMEPINPKHERLFKRWTELCPDGSWHMTKIPAVPTAFSGGTFACRKLSFTDSSIKGMIGYCLRVPEEARNSDTLQIGFNPEHVDYPFLVHHIIPMIIETFSPHEITLGDEEFRVPYINPNGPTYVGGPRACGGFLEAVFFMDAERIQRIFGFDLDTFIEKITPTAEKVIRTGGGAYVIGSSSALPFEQALALTKSMEAATEKESWFRRLQRSLGIHHRKQSA